jgi:hypothetical protein
MAPLTCRDCGAEEADGSERLGLRPILDQRLISVEKAELALRYDPSHADVRRTLARLQAESAIEVDE